MYSPDGNEEMTKTVTIWYNTRYGYTTISCSDFTSDPDYIQLSKPVDVEFVRFSDVEIHEFKIANALMAIEECEGAHRTDMKVLSDNLENLRALPAPS